MCGFVEFSGHSAKCCLGSEPRLQGFDTRAQLLVFSFETLGAFYGCAGALRQRINLVASDEQHGAGF
jgi:hypothetical protein